MILMSRRHKIGRQSNKNFFFHLQALKLVMNYTLKQLQERVNKLIEAQGEDAYCGAWIYTKEDVCIITDDGDELYPCSDNPELTERIFNDVGNIDYIYTVIQDCVNEVSEEQYMNYQQELQEVAT